MEERGGLLADAEVLLDSPEAVFTSSDSKCSSSRARCHAELAPARSRRLRCCAGALCMAGLLGVGLRLTRLSARGAGKMVSASLVQGVTLDGTRCLWTRYKGCLIPGFNTALFQDKTVKTCLSLCEEDNACKSVEFADDRQAPGDLFAPGVCILQSVDRGAKDYSDVLGYRNVDLYIKDCSWATAEAEAPRSSERRGGRTTVVSSTVRPPVSTHTLTTTFSPTAKPTVPPSTVTTTPIITTLPTTVSTTLPTTIPTTLPTTPPTTLPTTLTTTLPTTTFCLPERKKMQPSLFGFAVMTPGPEVALLKSQFAKQTSIFGCNDYAVISVQKLSFGNDECGKEVWTWCNPYLKEVGIGKLDGGDTTNSWLNTGTFINAWDMLMKSPVIWSHAWIAKVDPDAVMLADRLRSHVAPYTGAPHYVLNCNWAGAKKIFGAVEVFSVPAISEYKKRPEICKNMPWHGWGEDMYMQKCMDSLGVASVEDFNLVGDARCSNKPCEDGSVAAFHPYKDVANYWNCWARAVGS